MEEDIVMACKEAIEWANENGKNELGAALAVLRALNKHNALIK